jgi:hypothetical protein
MFIPSWVLGVIWCVVAVAGQLIWQNGYDKGWLACSIEEAENKDDDYAEEY